MGNKTSKNSDDTKDTEQQQPQQKSITLADVDKMIKDKDPTIKTEFGLEFEIWYKILKDHTMKTHLVQLTNQQAMAIVALCEHKKDHNRTLEQSQQTVINTIIQTIDDLITENNYTENGVFIRFSHRSPKDAVFKIDKDKFAEAFKDISLRIYKQDKELIKSSEFDESALIINSALRGLVLAASNFQCIKTGKKAMEVAGHSHRVFRDFKIGDLDHGQDFKPFMIIREFYHNLQFEAEFRCFVMKNKLTVITQYHSLCYVKFLVDNKDEIKKSILKYWEETVHPLMKEKEIESYVLDVVWLKKDDGGDEEKKENDDCDGDGYNWIVIELNPMCTNAGAGLFEWTKDYEMFLDGTCTDFRVREEMYGMTPKELEDGLDAFKDTVKFLEEQNGR